MSNKIKNTKMVAELPAAEDPEAALAIADLMLRPNVNAATVIAEYGTTIYGEQNIKALSDMLADSISEVNDGNLKNCEAMLLNQAYALQTIFVSLSRRAIKQEYVKNHETFLRLALKAQSQCRTTIETLAALKNPPVIFAKQANIAQGHQQVNNNQGSFPTHIRAHAPARENKFDSN